MHKRPMEKVCILLEVLYGIQHGELVIYGYVKYSIKIGGKVDRTEIFSYNQMLAEEKKKEDLLPNEIGKI